MGLKAGAIFVKVVADGIELLVVEMGFGVFIAQDEQLINQVRQGKQRRSAIEAISLCFKGTHLTTGVLAGLENLH